MRWCHFWSAWLGVSGNFIAKETEGIPKAHDALHIHPVPPSKTPGIDRWTPENPVTSSRIKCGERKSFLNEAGTLPVGKGFFFQVLGFCVTQIFPLSPKLFFHCWIEQYTDNTVMTPSHDHLFVEWNHIQQWDPPTQQMSIPWMSIMIVVLQSLYFPVAKVSSACKFPICTRMLLAE